MGHSLGGHLRGRSESLKSNRSSVDESGAAAADDQDETVVEPEQNNVLSHIISQLRPGADLSRITLPTFILEERSMLERITNFMAHPDTLLPMTEIDDPLQRFVSVIKFYLSGWHIRPPGVKKPLNPILGEIFTCYWNYPGNTQGYYVSEQTSHHPPKSSYFFMAPNHHIRIDGTLKPRSKFLGNSAASMMEGISYLRFTNRGRTPGGEKYVVTQPNMYARGILFGKMKYELGDHAFVRCPENGLSADIEFKTKGWVGGTYNAVGGFIKNDKTGDQLFEILGVWTGEMFIKDLRTGQKTLLFDATHAKHSPPQARPIAEQGERESQRLWASTVKAVHVADHDTATTEKAKIEDRQREEAKQREASGETWMPKLFRRVRAGPGESEEGEADLEWIINANIDGKDPQTITKQVLAIAPILPKSETPSNLQTNSKASTSMPSSGPNANSHQSSTNHGESLIDFGSRSSSTTPATVPQNTLKGNPMHPTSNPQQIPSQYQNVPKQSNLMDDDHSLSQGIQNMSMQQPMLPRGPHPLKRTDTDTNEPDVFVDAQD